LIHISSKEYLLSNKKLPDYRLKQKILYIDKTDAEILKNYGNTFLDAGFISDAIDFYNKANYYDGLEKIKALAFETGDVMFFQRVMKALNTEPSQADWEMIGQKAISLKKYLFAKHALEKAGKPEILNSLLKIMEAESTIEK
jgi:tetratricopeptide (TPR) repeat protein